MNAKVETKSLWNNFLTNIFMIMFLGLAITAGTAELVVAIPILSFFYTNTFASICLMITVLVSVFLLTSKLEKLNKFWATASFLGYSVLNGLFLSIISAKYTSVVILPTLLSTTALFVIMAFYGYFTKKDLLKYSDFFITGLIGLIVALLINVFFQSNSVSIIISMIAIVIFSGLTAFDIQEIREEFNSRSSDNSDELQHIAIRGALSLYLDFINMFIHLLNMRR